MHNHVAYSGRKALLKQIFSVFLIFTIYFNAFNSAFASAADLGGWTITSKVAQGASTLINASKTAVINGSNVAKTSTALLRPTATQVAKILARGSGLYALTAAVEMILGSVDWVLDPENSMIRYKKSAQCVELKDCSPTAEYLFRRTPTVNEYYTNPNTACEAVASSFKQKLDKTDTYTDSKGSINGGKCHTIDNSGNPDQWSLDTVINPNYKPDAKDEEKTLGLDVVAQKVIDNAESASDQEVKAGSQTVTVGAIDDALQNDAATQSNAKNQLEANAKTQTKEDAQGDTKPKDPTKPELGDELSLKFPVFCSWAPTVCEAAQTAISFPQTVTSWWDFTKEHYETAVTSITDFFKNEPDKSDSDNDLPVQDIPLPELNTGTFKATAGCPAPIPINITIGTKGTGEISYEPICQFASKWSFVAPLIGFLSAAMILIGVGRKGEDSEI